MPNAFRILKPIQKSSKRVWVFRNTGANAFAKNQMRLAYEDKRDLYCTWKFTLGIDMWSLFVPIHVTSWPKAKLGQVEVRSNIAQNRLFSRWEVICGHYTCMCQLMSKVDQKWRCIKLKSVTTLLKIACLAHRKSYVVIICANSVKSLPKEKLGQVKVGSNIKHV